MVALREKRSAKGSIGVKDIQTGQAQVVLPVKLKKPQNYNDISFLFLIPLLHRKKF